jgi:hypothetical protein
MAEELLNQSRATVDERVSQKLADENTGRDADNWKSKFEYSETECQELRK